MQQKEELLLVARYPKADMAALESRYVVHVLSEATDRQALLAALGPKIRALATDGESGAKADLMDALPLLEIIVCYGVGVDAIDLQHAAKLGIRVTNTPDVLTGDVADMGMALLLAAARQIPANDAYVRNGQWGKVSFSLTTRVFGKRLGIIGLGRVGRAVAKRASAFDMPVAYYDRTRFDDVDYTFFASAKELARNSDFLMVCASASAENRSSIGMDVLNALGEKGILVNIARGSIVDEAALLECLENGRIRGAALDVFWNEPNIDPRFRPLANVVLQAHRSSATTETRAAMAELVRGNLQAFFENKPLPSEYKLP